MGNIWEFLLQTLTVSLTAAVLLIVKYLLADKLSPRWQYGIWGLLALRALIPAGMTRQVLLPLPAWVDMCKTAAERGLASAYAGPWDAMDADVYKRQEVDDAVGLGAVVAPGADVGHDVVPELLLIARGGLVVDDVEVLPELGHLLRRHGQAERALVFSQR